MNKTLLLSIPLLIASNGAYSQKKAKKQIVNQHKYNVLFITADDLNCDLGSYEDPLVKTPNLDRLRQHAVKFSQAYCQFPLSGPSRASFMTGYSPQHTGVMDLETNFREKLPNAVTLPELFKQNGYYTARVGKIFHAGVPSEIGKPGMDDPQSWMETYNPIGIDRTHQDKVINLNPQMKIGASLSFMATDGGDDEHTDAIGANVAAALIRENKDKPFFIAMGFYRPHAPMIAPRKYFDMYPLDKITLPTVYDEEWANLLDCSKNYPEKNYGLQENDLKRTVQSYYATITFVDEQIGKLLDVLHEEGLDRNTIIVFLSDHGYNLGQHGMWKKNMLFEQTSRVPLIISVPGMTESELVSSEIVELLDVYPTLSHLCQLKNIPADLDGKDITPLLVNPYKKCDWLARSIVFRGQRKYIKLTGKPVYGNSIRYGNYRYTNWGVDNTRLGEELYDYSKDPEEHVNLVGNPDYKELQELLNKKWNEVYNKTK